jgi:hypothetical protein
MQSKTFNVTIKVKISSEDSLNKMELEDELRYVINKSIHDGAFYAEDEEGNLYECFIEAPEHFLDIVILETED